MTTKKKRGRPVLPKGEAKTEIVQVRLTKQEKAVLDEMANAAGCPISELLRIFIVRNTEHMTLFS